MGPRRIALLAEKSKKREDAPSAYSAADQTLTLEPLF
tara:strand:- start:591 stop:701 length:111 start_codon:yes stop_codon:yes gene_type:complete